MRKQVVFHKAQGKLPWAFFASIGIHLLVVWGTLISTPETTRSKYKQVRQPVLIQTDVKAILRNERQPPTEPLIAPTEDVQINNPNSLHQKSSEKGQNTSTPMSRAEVEIDLPSEKIQPIAIPEGIWSIWGNQQKSPGKTAVQATENAQWHARKIEALRQLTILEQGFASAPSPESSTYCVITFMKRQCTEGAEIFGDYWVAKFAYLFGIDPNFSPIEMHYEVRSGWYVVIGSSKKNLGPNAP